MRNKDTTEVPFSKVISGVGFRSSSSASNKIYNSVCFSQMRKYFD